MKFNLAYVIIGLLTNEQRDNMVAEKEKTEKAQKPVKKIEKLIWFIVSAVIAAGGAICHTNGIKFNIWVSVIYSALLLFTIVMAAQRTSIERFGYADDESSPNKTKYVLTSVLYYIFIFIAVIYAFLALWVSGVFSI